MEMFSLVGTVTYLAKLSGNVCLTAHPNRLICIALAIVQGARLGVQGAVYTSSRWERLVNWSVCTLVLLPVLGMILVLPAPFVFPRGLSTEIIPAEWNVWMIPTKDASVETIFRKSTSSNRWVVGFGGQGATYVDYWRGVGSLGDAVDANVLLVNHRGVGRGSGTFVKSEQLVSDAQMVVEALMGRFNVKEEDVVLYGHSVSGPVVAKLPFYKSAYLIDRSLSKPGVALYASPKIIFLLVLPIKRLTNYLFPYGWRILSVCRTNSNTVEELARVYEPQRGMADEIKTLFNGLSLKMVLPRSVRRMPKRVLKELTRELAAMSATTQLGFLSVCLVLSVACASMINWALWLIANQMLQVIASASIVYTIWETLPLDKQMLNRVSKRQQLLVIVVLALLIDFAELLMVGYDVKLNAIDPLVDKIERGVRVGIIYTKEDFVIPYYASTHYGLVSKGVKFHSTVLYKCLGRNQHMAQLFDCQKPEQLINWLQKVLL